MHYTLCIVTTCFGLLWSSSGTYSFLHSPSIYVCYTSLHWPVFTHWECVVRVYCFCIASLSMAFSDDICYQCDFLPVVCCMSSRRQYLLDIKFCNDGSLVQSISGDRDQLCPLGPTDSAFTWGRRQNPVSETLF
jgi:hypothetical protein